MTAWNCVEFAEFFAFKYLVVENVCEMSEWGLFDAWINTFRLLDYRVNIVNFNSQFAGVAQSRDRIYVVLWKKDMPAPNLDFRPQAHCHECGEVGAIQSWKRLGVPGMSVGRWGAQYVYRCEKCLSVVVPDRVAAGTKIDWSLPSLRVGDRTKKPIVENTLRRLEKGLRRFYPDAFQENPRPVTEDQMPPSGFILSNREDNRATHPGEPIHTITASGSHWLAQPPMAFIDTLRRDSCATTIDEPISTVMAQGTHHALVQVPGFIAGYHGGRDAVQGTDEPAWTIATSCQHGLVQPPEGFITSYYGNGGESKISNPAPTIRTTAGHALVQPPLAAADIAELVQNCLYRMLSPDEAKRLMGFPYDYILLGNKQQQQKQAGNAVTPPVAKMIGAAIVEAFSRA
jgi:DNA (cytosine-5)-methyltransferase 1